MTPDELPADMEARTPAPEGEAWRTVPVEPTEAMIEAAHALWGEGTGVNYVQLEPEDFYAAMLAASPVVPVGSEEALPPISLDGPHKIGEHRQWLARQLLDSRQDDAEAYSTVIYSPAMTDIWRDGVVPVGVRERVLDELDKAWLHGQRRTSWRRDESADAILAAFRPTDTGGGNMTTPDIAGLCERLRAVESSGHGDVTTNWHRNPDGPQAADTLERQAAEIERLREALENVLASTVGPEVGAGDGGTFILRSPSPDALRRARAALTGEDT